MDSCEIVADPHTVAGKGTFGPVLKCFAEGSEALVESVPYHYVETLEKKQILKADLEKLSKLQHPNLLGFIGWDWTGELRPPQKNTPPTPQKTPPQTQQKTPYKPNKPTKTTQPTNKPKSGGGGGGGCGCRDPYPPIQLLREMMYGSQLSEALDSLTPNDCVEIARQVASAMAYLHSHDMAGLHLDPTKICKEFSTNHVKLLAYGFEQTQEQASMCHKHTGYTAHPELSAKQADAYSIGVLLYTMLSKDLMMGKVTKKEVKEKISAFVQANQAVGPKLLALISKCCLGTQQPSMDDVLKALQCPNRMPQSHSMMEQVNE